MATLRIREERSVPSIGAASLDVIQVAFHILDLLLVLRQVGLQTLVLLCKRLVVGGRDRLRRRLWGEGWVFSARAHPRVIIDVLLQA